MTTYELGPILDRLGVEYDPDKTRNQKVKCPVHDDEVASASVNLDEGLINCFPVKDDRPLQTRAQLGTPQSHGCIRQALPDAVAMWRFASAGTTVVVV